MLLEDDFKLIAEMKNDEEWPPVSISTKGLIPYVKRYKQPIKVLDIGLGQGHGAYHLLEHGNIETYYWIDPYEAYENDALIKFDQSQMDRIKSNMITNLHEFGSLVQEYPDSNPKVDILFIDVDNKHDTIRALLDRYASVVNSGGIIAVRNGQIAGVNRAIKEFRRETRQSGTIHTVQNSLWFWVLPRAETTIPRAAPQIETKSEGFNPNNYPHIKSYAQLGQDLWVLFETQNDTSDRQKYFVEFGATDGIVGSNTKALEEQGWKGILAEPNPIWHNDLARNRNAIIVHDAVFSRTGEKVSFACPSAPDLGTIQEYSDKDYHAETRKGSPLIEVNTISLNDLLAKHDAPTVIDYISIDTEGSEYDIIKEFDFQKYDVKCFSIEHNYNKELRDKVFDLLSSKGYSRVYEQLSKWDDFFVKS